MLRVLGSPKRLCDGLTRRDLLWAGGLCLGGLTLENYLRGSATAGPRATAGRFGQAKACILLYLYGAASQLEWCDMKPEAPAEVRGELRPIASRVPGVAICECLPALARVMDRVTVVRSMTHPYPTHGVAYALTGTPTIDPAMELHPHDSRHWPFVGSVVDYLARHGKQRKPAGAAPDNMALPFPFSTQRTGEVRRAGPYPAFLGGAYDPVWTEFHGKATRSVLKTLNQKQLEVWDPYLGVTPESRFGVSDATTLAPELTLDRVHDRRGLLEQLERARRGADEAAARTTDRARQMAHGLLDSEAVRTALDIGREPDRLRESYGRTLFGQAALTARRLVEAGSRFVSVFWDEYGLAGSGWDTHWDHYPRLKNELLPGLDKALAGLIDDLDARGMLDSTLVLCLTEHGRTPRLANVSGGGRDHWAQAYSVMMAGGGLAGGQVIGKTDKMAGTVVDRPVSPKDILATTYHLLGFDPETELRDRTGRPLPLVANGKVMREALA